MSLQGFRLVETSSATAPWYRPLPKVQPKTLGLLQNYSKIKKEDVPNHLTTYREKAWNIRPYPCVGMWNFLKSNILWSQLDNEYDLILRKVKAGGRLLDVGCGLGQDLRYLANDGAPTQNMFATDLTSDFWNLSLDFFRDQHTIGAQTIFCDFFDRNSELLRRLEGTVDVIISSDFLHLFDWERQVEAASIMARLCAPKRGSMIIGKQIGREHAEGIESGFAERGVMFMHNDASFKKMWDQAAGPTGGTWKVRTKMVTMGTGEFWGPKEDFGFFKKGSQGLQFVITREDDN